MDVSTTTDTSPLYDNACEAGVRFHDMIVSIRRAEHTPHYLPITVCRLRNGARCAACRGRFARPAGRSLKRGPYAWLIKPAQGSTGGDGI